ncbi:MAG: TolC family protein [Chitinophagaceae bacterium]|nr:TolC family protein [Oligoflexus sp.]
MKSQGRPALARSVISVARNSLIIWIVLLDSQARAETPTRTISIDEYLDSVRAANGTMKIAATTIEAGELRSTTPDMAYTPQFFTQASHTVDSKPSVNPLAPDRIEATNISTGVQKLWESGLQSQVSFNITRFNLNEPTFANTIPVPLALPNPAVPGSTVTQIVNVPNPTKSLLPQSEYTEARTQIDLVQPLLKGGGGRDLGLVRDSTLTKITIQQLSERYKVKSLLAQAEYIYWQLALAQEAVRTQEGSIERFRKLRDWAKGRASSQLGDKADLLQADSGLKVKYYELEQAKKDCSSLQRIFNTLRGIGGDKVDGELVPLSSKALTFVYLDEASQTAIESVKRLDVEIAKQAEKLAQIDIEQSREKYRAQLDVFGTAAFNALDRTSEQALVGAVQNKHPTYIVGVKFSTPLDQDIINRDREGLIKTGEAAKLDKDVREFNARQDWDDLQTQLRDSQVRLKLAGDIEEAQKEKLAYERQRLSSGRTTTYQVLMFEQDYASAQLNSIKSKAEILGILARLKSFGDAS